MGDQPYWLIFLENTLDKIENGTISKEQGEEMIRKNTQLPDEVRMRYGWRPRGRPKKDG
jgi:hypothetical protein